MLGVSVADIRVSRECQHGFSNSHATVCPAKRSAKTKANIWHKNEALAFGASIGAKKWRGPPAHTHTHTGTLTHTLTNVHLGHPPSSGWFQLCT
jgi:hypothetical protein